MLSELSCILSSFSQYEFSLKLIPLQTEQTRDKEALVSSSLPGFIQFAYGNVISYDPALVGLTSYFFSMYKHESLFM